METMIFDIIFMGIFGFVMEYIVIKSEPKK
jgi:hypothetical protein